MKFTVDGAAGAISRRSTEDQMECEEDQSDTTSISGSAIDRFENLMVDDNDVPDEAMSEGGASTSTSIGSSSWRAEMERALADRDARIADQDARIANLTRNQSRKQNTKRIIVNRDVRVKVGRGFETVSMELCECSFKPTTRYHDEKFYVGKDDFKFVKGYGFTRNGKAKGKVVYAAGSNLKGSLLSRVIGLSGLRSARNDRDTIVKIKNGEPLELFRENLDVKLCMRRVQEDLVEDVADDELFPSEPEE